MTNTLLHCLLFDRINYGSTHPSKHKTHKKTNKKTCVQCWTNVKDVGPTLYKCYANVLYLLGYLSISESDVRIDPRLGGFNTVAKNTMNTTKGFLAYFCDDIHR